MSLRSAINEVASSRRRSFLQEGADLVYLNGVKTVYNHILPRGKAITMSEPPPKPERPLMPWEFEPEYRFVPMVVMNAEDYLEFCRVMKCWDAALDCLKSIIRNKIDSGVYWRIAEEKVRKGCSKSCSPGDFYPGGKCDKNGCL